MSKGKKKPKKKVAKKKAIGRKKKATKKVTKKVVRKAKPKKVKATRLSLRTLSEKIDHLTELVNILVVHKENTILGETIVEEPRIEEDTLEGEGDYGNMGF